MTSPAPSADPQQRNIYLTLTVVLQALLVLGLVLFILRRDWENVFLTAAVIVLTLAPIIVDRQFKVLIPPEFGFVAAFFVFLSLFLGSATDFYYKYEWWDIVLHTSSGFLLGIIGFIALFWLNSTDRVPRGMQPGFICFFAVTFAVFLGVLWEVFEFVVDQFTDANMQSTEEGVKDTMQDLIVDTIGAVIVALMGYAYSKSGRYSFIADGVRKFIVANPRLFRQHHTPDEPT
jgi:hypothetical protein